MTHPGHPLFRRRAGGVLLHPTSWPGGQGSGDLGPPARRFVDWLETAGLGLWQMLPIGPVGKGNSPYSGRSAFAGEPLLISRSKDPISASPQRPLRRDAGSAKTGHCSASANRLTASDNRSS